MANQQYSLRWNNHQQNFITIFKSLLDFEELVDVTLSAEGKHIKAHKIVLSACSPYFKLLFSTTPCKHPIVIISDVKYSDLKTIIEFIYSGEISVYNEKLADFLEAAKTLEIKGLYDSKQNENCPENVNGFSNKVIERKPECNTPKEDSNSGGSEHNVVNIDPVIQSDHQTYREECLTKLDGNRSVQNYLVENPLEVKDLNYSIDEGKHSEDVFESSACAVPVDTNAGECESFIGHYIDVPEHRSHDMKAGGRVLSKPFATGSFENHPDGMESDVGKFTTQPILDSSPYVPMSVSNSGPRPGRPQKERNSENFLLALEAVRSGKLGFCKAAKLYGVNNRTLWLEYKKRGYPSLRPPVGIRKYDT